MKRSLLILFVLVNGICFGQESKEFTITGTVIDKMYPEHLNLFELYFNDTFSGVTKIKNEFVSRKTYRKGDLRITFKRKDFVIFDTTVFVDNAHTHFNFIVQIPCLYYGKKEALLDIEKDSAKLYLHSGLDLIIFENDKDFKTKYNVEYYDFGCMMPRENCIIEYNETIFEFLDKNFGTIWREDIRKDVIGYLK